MRPSLRSRPTRKRSAPTETALPTERSEDRPLVREVSRPAGLENLGLTTRELMILHSLNIRSPHDLINASEKLLAKHLTMTAINSLKDRARNTERHVVPDDLADTDISDAEFSKQIVAILKRMGLKKLRDFSHLSKRDLWTQSQLGRVDVQRILRACRDHGVTLRDG